MKLYAERELALLDRKAGIPTPDAPPVEPAPKLSADPREAALGMTEPGRTNERAVEEMIAQYPDMADLPESARRFCRAVSAAIDPEQVSDVVTLIRTLRPMATAAREQQWSAPFAMKELERRHGETKAAAIAKDAARVWEPLGADRALFEDDWIEDYPDAIERIAKFADKFFSSDAGLRLTLERSAAALAAKERGEAMEREKAKAEAVERDRQINEQFGR